MQRHPLKAGEAVAVVGSFYREKTAYLQSCGFNKEHIWLDPGIGFGKSDAANIQLLAHVHEKAAEYQLVVGISRKSFLGRILEIDDPVDRDAPSKMLELGLMIAGVRAIRTHDVRRLSQLRRLMKGEN